VNVCTCISGWERGKGEGEGERESQAGASVDVESHARLSLRTLRS